MGWKNDYLRQSAYEKLKRDNIEESTNALAKIIFTIAYEKYLIDYALDNNAYFTIPNVNEIYNNIMQGSDEFNHITRELLDINIYMYKYHDHEPVNSQRIQNKVDELYSEYRASQVKKDDLHLFIIIALFIATPFFICWVK